MLGLEFSIHHHGCPGTRSTERFPDVQSKVLSCAVDHEGVVSSLRSVESRTTEELNGYLNFWRQHSGVRRFRLAALDEREALFSVMWAPAGRSILEVILEHGGFYSTPIPMCDGLETWTVLLPKETGRLELFSNLEAVGVVKMTRVRRVDRSDALSTGSWAFAGTSPPASADPEDCLRSRIL